MNVGYDNPIDVGGPLPADVLRGVRVIFADESSETIDMFRHIVNRLGWDGIYTSTAVALMDTVNNLFGAGQHIDAIVADVRYKDSVTGITAARQIRQAMPNVPILFVTSYVTSMIKEEVRRVDGEIIKKPFDPEELFVHLSQLIYWHRLATYTNSNLTHDGVERRQNSVNRTSNFRRVTDKILKTPERIKSALAEGRK